MLLVLMYNKVTISSGRLEKDVDRKTEALAVLTEKFKATEAKV